MDDFGLYVICDRPASGVEAFARACVEARVALVQVRRKDGPDHEVLQVVAALKEVFGASASAGGWRPRVVVNDRVDLALASGADGVHLGQDDMDPARARSLLPPGSILGLSTHNLAQVEAAMAFRPDYIGFGPLFATPSKKNHDPATGMDILPEVLRRARCPVVAIGGIFPEHLPDLAARGVRNLCALRYLNHSDDPGRDMRALQEALGFGAGPGAGDGTVMAVTESATLVDRLRAGEMPRIVEACALAEGVEAGVLADLVARGRVVIPRNRARGFAPRGVGEGLVTKVNANFGTSGPLSCTRTELAKLEAAVEAGADAVMDLSCGADPLHMLGLTLAHSSVMVGSVPLYSLFADPLRPAEDFSADEIIGIFRTHAEMGVDFVTLHAGITRQSLKVLEGHERVLGVVSRGGALMARWMAVRNEENPLYSRFAEILDICRTHEVTLSLGDGLRPGGGCDANDRGQIAELLVLGELVEESRRRGVQVMVEGPGHVPLDQVEGCIRTMKRLCGHAPVYVLGPLACDTACGHDHIAAAIGGGIAAAAGADFLCHVTPAEHLCLPDVADTRTGVIASRIAARAGDIVKNAPGVRAAEARMCRARADLDWDGMYAQALDAPLARQRGPASGTGNTGDEALTGHGGGGGNGPECTMCGNLCAIRNHRKAREAAGVAQ